MSYDELYESCFRNVSLVRVPQTNKSKEVGDPSLLVTLDHVMSSSQYVVFFLAGSQTSSAYGPRAIDLAQKLEALVHRRNNSGDKEGKEKAQSSPARIRRFFGIKKKKKTRSPSEQVSTSVVVVETDPGRGNQENLPNVGLPGWYIFAPQDVTTKTRLLRALGFDVAPSLTVVETSSRMVVTTEGRRLLHDDPNGEQFPWFPPSTESVLRGSVTGPGESGEKKTVEWKDLSSKVRALFFGAYWCPPCRQWTKQLTGVYESLKKHDISIEIIFCSSDRSQEVYDEFIGTMPWLAFPYDPSHTLLLTRLFNISGIPSLILIDEENRILTRHGRQALVADPKGAFFPWGPCPLYELTELSVCRLRDEPSLILFTEGSPEDVRFSTTILQKISKQLFDEKVEWERRREQEARERNDENGNSNSGTSTPQMRHSASQEECSSVDSDVVLPAQADPLQVFYTGEDPICDHILERILGLGEAELPLICIVDALGGRISVCADPDVSEEVLDNFVSTYKSGKLSWNMLPSAGEKGGRTVGGIPMHEIEKALMGNSPSQNSISADPQHQSPKETI